MLAVAGILCSCGPAASCSKLLKVRGQLISLHQVMEYKIRQMHSMGCYFPSGY